MFLTRSSGNRGVIESYTWVIQEDLHENITSWACLDKSRLKDNLHGTMCTFSYQLIQSEKQRHYPKEENEIKKYKSNEVQLI